MRIALCLALAVASLCASGASFAGQSFSDTLTARQSDELRMHFLNVGTGSCTVIECPGPDAPPMIVDCGATARGAEDLTRAEISAYVQGVLRANPLPPNLVLSHGDADHYSLVPTALMKVRVGHIWQGGDATHYTGTDFAEWIAYQETNGADRHHSFATNFHNARLPLDEHLSCGAAQPYVLTVNSGRTRNSQSLILMIRYHDFSAILAGDATGFTESAALENFDGALQATLLATSHHGADTMDSNSEPWADAVAPSILISSAGRSYYHPRCSAIERFDTLVLTAEHDVRCGNRGRFETFLTDRAHFVTSVNGIVTVTTTGRAQISVACTRSPSCAGSIPLKAVTDTFPPSVRPPISSSIVIRSAVPNPVGDDEEHETVTIANVGDQEVAISDWSLRDRSGLAWSLSGVIRPQESRIIRRQRQPMSLDDAGDEIRLSDSFGRLVDQFVYASVPEGSPAVGTFQNAAGHSPALPRTPLAQIQDGRLIACVAAIIILCFLIYMALRRLETRQRIIRDSVSATILRSDTLSRIDRYLIQTLINSEARKHSTLHTPVVDEVLDETLAIVLRSESPPQTQTMRSPPRTQEILNGLAKTESTAVVRTPQEDSASDQSAGTVWWRGSEDEVIRKLRRLKPGTLAPPGLDISTIFVLLASAIGVLVVALILLPGTWSVAGTWLDEILTTIAVVGGGSVATALVAVRRRLGLLVERESNVREFVSETAVETSESDASESGTKKRTAGPPVGRPGLHPPTS